VKIWKFISKIEMEQNNLFANFDLQFWTGAKGVSQSLRLHK